MNKPKYSIGDAFLIEREVKDNDCVFKGKFSYYVLAVTAESTAEGYTYKYGLGRSFPQAYLDGRITRWDYERTLNTLEKTEGYFGKT